MNNWQTGCPEKWLSELGKPLEENLCIFYDKKNMEVLREIFDIVQNDPVYGLVGEGVCAKTNAEYARRGIKTYLCPKTRYASIQVFMIFENAASCYGSNAEFKAGKRNEFCGEPYYNAIKEYFEWANQLIHSFKQKILEVNPSDESKNHNEMV